MLHSELDDERKSAADEMNGKGVRSVWLTHRGTGRVLLRLVTVAAGGLRGAGRSSRGAHQMEHMVLILL